MERKKERRCASVSYLFSFFYLKHPQQAHVLRPIQTQQDVSFRPQVRDLAVANEVGLGERFESNRLPTRLVPGQTDAAKGARAQDGAQVKGGQAGGGVQEGGGGGRWCGVGL